jgi:hypothetical protein
MKKMMMALLCLLTVSTMALEISFVPGSGFSFPDFDSLDAAQEQFEQTVETLRMSDEVNTVVSNVEAGQKVACVSLFGKESAGLKWYKLPYRCEGEKDFKLTVKARLKKGKVIVKNYKVKY